MAQTRRKRTRKHRGTPAGTIERAGRTGRPQTREDAKQIARQRRQERADRPPTWGGAVNRAGFMFLLYIPLGYVTDSMIHRYRQRKKAGTR
jgi:hypothetical protein